MYFKLYKIYGFGHGFRGTHGQFYGWLAYNHIFHIWWKRPTLHITYISQQFSKLILWLTNSNYIKL